MSDNEYQHGRQLWSRPEDAKPVVPEFGRQHPKSLDSGLKLLIAIACIAVIGAAGFYVTTEWQDRKAAQAEESAERLDRILRTLGNQR